MKPATLVPAILPWLPLAAVCAQDAPTAPVLSRQPYVQMTTPSSAVIVWRTQGRSTPQVTFGESLARMNGLASSSRIITRVLPPFVFPEDPPPDTPANPAETPPAGGGRGVFGGGPKPPAQNSDGDLPPDLIGENPPPDEDPAPPPEGNGEDPPPGGNFGEPIPEPAPPVPAPAPPKQKGGKGPFGGGAAQVPKEPDKIDYSIYPQLHSAPEDTWQFEVTLTGLKPDTKYYYAVFNGPELLAGKTERHHFFTSPLPSAVSRPLRFLIIGDSGTGSLSQKESFQALQNFVAADKRGIDAFLHLGDMAYGSGLDEQFQAYFFDVYAPLLVHTTVWPTQGNHEGFTSVGSLQLGPYYDAYVVPTKGEAGGVASGTEAYYSFDYGPAHFVCLNSHDIDRTSSGEMAAWLKEDLARTKAKWLAAFFHHPPYTKGTHDSDWESQLVDMRTVFMPILESAGVDFVICGHSHIYERSMLIDGAYRTPTVVDGVVLDDGDGNPASHGAYRKSANLNPHEGTLAVVAGHGYSASRLGTMPVMREVWVEPGTFLLDIDGDVATGTMLNYLGQVRDRFQLIKRGKVTPARVEHPWRPVGPLVTTSQPGAGTLQVAIAPQPSAPDAVIHYTLDGSEPTTNSPRYVGPFELNTDARVKAFSLWRNGQRKSLTTDSGALTVSRQLLARVPVQHSEDDASERQGRIDRVGASLTVGANGDQRFGLRFRNLQIPRGALITRAYVQFTAAGENTKDNILLIRGEAVDSAAPYNDGLLSNRATTVQTVQWLVPRWFAAGIRNDLQRTPDLSLVLQEVLNRPGWNPGNSLSLLFSGNGASSVVSADGGVTDSPELVVAYEPGGPLAASVRQPPAVQLMAEKDGGRFVQVAFRRLKSPQNYALTYFYETTTNLASAVWEPFSLGADAASAPTDGAWELVNFRLTSVSPSGPKQRFLRLRVVGGRP